MRSGVRTIPTLANHYHWSWQCGRRSDSPPGTLGSISLLAHLLARRGRVESALKALTFAEQHPATMARDRLYNQPLLAELRSELDPTFFEQTTAWAASQTLDDVVHWLLHSEASLPMAVYT